VGRDVNTSGKSGKSGSAQRLRGGLLRPHVLTAPRQDGPILAIVSPDKRTAAATRKIIWDRQSRPPDADMKRAPYAKGETP
jgi:hypothetical protein